MARKRINPDAPQLPFEEWSAEEFNKTISSDPVYSNVPKEESASVAVNNDFSDKRLFYLSMGSGSSGNCCYVGSKSGGVLIDAGVNGEEVLTMLRSNGIDIRDVKGILLTHDHSDHVKFVYSLVRAHKHLKVFCSNRVLNGLLRRHNISKRIKEFHIPVFKEIPFKILDLEITAFDVPHDGTDNMGYSIEVNDQRFVLATDLGAVTERARHYMSGANYLVIESNYDKVMLRNGRYPEYLKARIMTDHGHLDNEETAKFLSEIINPSLRYVFLCHLSADNNTPEKAVEVSRQKLESMGQIVGKGEETLADRSADVQLVALPRYGASRLYVFRP